jgi:hypothetical protein
MAAPATHNRSRVTSTTGVNAGFEIRLDRRTHTYSVTAPKGTVVTRNLAGTVTARQSARVAVASGSPGGMKPNTIGSYDCIVETQQNSNFRGYQPSTLTANGNSYTIRWQFNPYSVDYARFISNYWTFQVEVCFTGGGTSWNHWHQWYNSGTTTTTGPGLIGSAWGQGDSNSTSTSSTISFQVGAGPVSIGASTTITPGAGSFGGGTGHEPNASQTNPGPDSNRVYAYFQSPDTWIWDGTGSFEGNNGHALYEEPEVGGSVVDDYFYLSAQYLCGVAYGLCSALN